MNNVNYNIDINPSLLNDTILSLKKDEDNIKEKINLIFNNLFELTDDNIWKSPEKSAILNELMLYIRESNNNINNQLNNCLTLLDNALNNYLENNNALEKDSQKLARVEVIEEL